MTENIKIVFTISMLIVGIIQLIADPKSAKGDVWMVGSILLGQLSIN